MGVACLLGMAGVAHEVSAQVVPSEIASQAELPIARLGVPYIVSLQGGGGVPPYRLEVIRGSLPDGLYFDTQGRLVGTPGSMGSYLFTVRLTDGAGAQVVQDFHLTVGLIPTNLTATSTAPSVSTPPAAAMPSPPVSPMPTPSAPPLPAGVPTFPRPPLLGSPVGGAPTLLPYTPSVPSAPLGLNQGNQEMGVGVGSATTATQMELLQQLDRQGIQIDSLVRIPFDPSGVNDNVTYYVGRDGRRHPFLHPSALESWYRNGASVVRTVTAQELQTIPLGSGIVHRPGVNVLQFEGPTMYVVTGPRSLRPLVDAQAAATIYGPNWYNRLVGLSDAYFASYRVNSGELPVRRLEDFSPSTVENSVHLPSDSI